MNDWRTAFAREGCILRSAFDPRGLANPGKVFPTPRLCGEVPGPYRAHPLERAGLVERL
jgi:glycolate oxidase